MKTATLALRNTMSAVQANSRTGRVQTRKRSPRAWVEDLAASSGRVSRDRFPCITRRTAGELAQESLFSPAPSRPLSADAEAEAVDDGWLPHTREWSRTVMPQPRPSRASGHSASCCEKKSSTTKVRAAKFKSNKRDASNLEKIDMARP